MIVSSYPLNILGKMANVGRICYPTRRRLACNLRLPTALHLPRFIEKIRFFLSITVLSELYFAAYAGVDDQRLRGCGVL